MGVLDVFDQLVGDVTLKNELTVWQVALRTVIVYVFAIALLRLAKRRFMGKHSTFDILIGLIVGSIMAKSIVGSARIIDMAVAVILLTLLHWLVSTLVFFFQTLERTIERKPRQLVIDGNPLADELRASKITEHDLLQAAREAANRGSIDDIDEAYLEHDGHISIVLKKYKTKGDG